ncbi:SAM-dependent methyltransferase [Rhodoferax koreense]|uniref:SAM-dependent methyltransferase n=2 Tax=Rhodoferax koreensis TaxID=1842727 RepID=A0A1P8K4L4_9BURK|nr:class I SAM-dependent methyltransferase [Rhodoferax koreense]APW40953.1 SAM-dependent methyltransferase [Rhodoferax koreense]
MRGTLTSYQRRALVMEVYNPNSIVQVSEVVHDLTVRAGERNIYKGKAVVVSLVNTGLMTVVSVTLTEEWNDIFGIQADPASFAYQANAFVDDWNSRFSIGQGYQVAVSELRAYLGDVARWVDQADLVTTLPRESSGRLRNDVFMGLAQPLMSKARDYFDRFEAEANVVDPELQSAHRVFAQAAIHPLILRAPFVYRTFAKPMGYAGDYEMVNQMLSDPREGTSTYFQIVNTLFLQAAVARAHRNRIDILETYLARFPRQADDSTEPIRVLNVGCGPAIEVQRLITTHPTPERLSFTLMDFSEETLAYTQSRIDEACAKRGVRINVEWVNESVHNLIKRAASGAARQLDEKQFEFVYCAGLFDYLSDKVCQRLLQYFLARTKAGGTILVTNVHRSNPERNTMEHLLEWHLIYRDENDMRRIAPESATLEKIYTDETGVNIFLELQNSTPSRAAAV